MDLFRVHRSHDVIAPLIEDFNPGIRTGKAKLNDIYTRLRSETPVVRAMLRGVAPGTSEAFLIARYADVSAALKDQRLVKDPPNAGVEAPPVPAIFRPLLRNMLALDDPDHARLRRLVQVAFTPRRVEMMATHARATSTALLDRLHGRTSFDLIREYALPLPVTVISELLGVPQRDRRRFARWSGAFLRGASMRALLTSLPDILAFLQYLKRLITMKREAPQDDLVSALVAAEAEGDEKLTSDELSAMIAILLSAGHETTVNLIGNGILSLLQNPDGAEAVRSNPSIIATGAEELLRYASPVEMSTMRYAREPLTVAGIEIPRGSRVICLIASANRDERQFVHADQLDLLRSPNRHVSFGEGGHYCLGASLARMEGKIAIPDILARFPQLRLGTTPDRLRWRQNPVLTGLERLPLIV
jgi:cytochrome P450 PksS